MNYNFSGSETILIGGFNTAHGGFGRRFRSESDNLVSALEAIVDQTMMLSTIRAFTPFTKKMVDGKLIDRKDYTDTTRKIEFSMYNPCCTRISGTWRDRAQSSRHLAPSISFSIVMRTKSATTDKDFADLINWFYDIGYNINWDGSKPSDKIWSHGLIGAIKRDRDWETIAGS